MTKAFQGGVHPNDFKGFTGNRRIEDLGIPTRVVMLMSQHTGAPAEVIVAVGDMVKRGTLIGRSTGFISTNIHASVAGKVTAVGDEGSALGFPCRAVTIEPEGDDVWAEGCSVEVDPNSLDAAPIRKTTLEGGVGGQ